MTRTSISLDGSWTLTLDPDTCLAPYNLPYENSLSVQVPAPWQSQSPELAHYSGTAWYRRSFDLPTSWFDPASAILLRFGAVDYSAEIWVNGCSIGTHEGGYLPFEFDLGRTVRPGQNEVIVRVSDPLENFPEVPHGKQSWYGELSGIWQSVWVERRAETHIQRVQITPLVAKEEVQVAILLSRPLTDEQSVCLEIYAPDGTCVAQAGGKASSYTLCVASPRLWEPESPYLYRLRAVVEGQETDEIWETFGFRTIETREGRILLNGHPVYLRAALDQDYYPDTITTPPSVEFLEDQFRQAKAMGLNCLRTHIKIADPRYYAAADRIGLLIWTELPNWQNLTPAARRRAQETLVGMLERDWNHPSIIIWTLINESWGIDLTDPDQRAWLAQSYDFLKRLDPFRLVVGNSACWGNYQVVTDIEDFHIYYAIPDHYRKWRSWVHKFSGHPAWTYAFDYPDYAQWRIFKRDPWKSRPLVLAPEARRRGDEPLVLSEFGNWGLPLVEKLYEHYQGEPWWFHTGLEWGEGVVYPHGVQDRFHTFHLDRAFSSLEALSLASQQQQYEALKYEIEQIRRQDSLNGYVITEFTDVHWECNGLLDLCRNPKIAACQLAPVNGADVLIPDWQRLSYWEGERVGVEVSLSHFSQQDLDGSRLEWELEDWPEVRGATVALQPATFGVTPLTRIRFTVPAMCFQQTARLHLRLTTADGTTAAQNYLELFFYPRPAAPHPWKLWAPELGPALEGLGYPLAKSLEEADCVVALTLTDELRSYLLRGGKVLWMAERDHAQKTYLGNLVVKAREETAWQGDWASSFIWLCQDRLFSDLPTQGLVNFAFADLTPDHVITGLTPMDFGHRVHAGLAAGWIQKAVGVVAETPVGAGQLLVSTFKLSRELRRHPLAQKLLQQMLSHLNKTRKGK